MPAAEPIPPPHPVSTTDALKAFALLLILVDHIGHFLADDWPILRVIGRLGVPIFFFLIGFARTRSIPARWVLLGTVLTLVDYLWTGTLSETQVNILFNFAAIRLALPFIERHALIPYWRIAPLMIGLTALMPWVNPVLEYGTEGWLFAITGLLHRRSISEGPQWDLPRDISGLFALAIYVMVERRDYDFEFLPAILLVFGIAGLAILVREFRRGDLEWQPPESVAAVMRFCGRYSLEIYAAQIIVLAMIGGLWSILDPEDGDDDDD